MRSTDLGALHRTERAPAIVREHGPSQAVPERLLAQPRPDFVREEQKRKWQQVVLDRVVKKMRHQATVRLPEWFKPWDSLDMTEQPVKWHYNFRPVEHVEVEIRNCARAIDGKGGPDHDDLEKLIKYVGSDTA